MKLLVRLRRLAVAINPERRLKIKSPGSRCQPSQSKTTMATTRKQPHRKNGSDARCSALKRKASSHCHPGKGNRQRSKLTISNPDAAGIDVGAEVHYVAVPEDRAEAPVRSFGAYSAQLDELVQCSKSAESKPWQWNRPESTGSPCSRSSKRLVWKCCWSMRGKPSMCLDVKATSRIANGCSSYTVTDCSERRFVPKTPFAACAPCNDIARTWSNARRCGFSTFRRLSTK